MKAIKFNLGELDPLRFKKKICVPDVTEIKGGEQGRSSRVWRRGAGHPGDQLCIQAAINEEALLCYFLSSKRYAQMRRKRNGLVDC
jgi:hypothetical protein